MSKMTIDNTIEMEEWVWIIEMDVVNALTRDGLLILATLIAQINNSVFEQCSIRKLYLTVLRYGAPLQT